jgi:serine/threonine protein kinase
VKICPSCGACSEDAYDLCAFDGSLLMEAFAGPRLLAERYLLEQRMAAGAMGIVFRALHLQIGSTVAVKLMQPKSDELQVGLQRFHREAQILGQIKHPHAVLVMDFGVEKRESGPLPFLVTEYLRGQPLIDRLQERQRFSLEEAAPIVMQVCDAVEEAHEVGVIHRDLKPSNIYLEQLRDGTEIVKVLDFGIAKFVELTGDVMERLQRDHAELAATYRETLEFDLLDEVAGVRGGGPGGTVVESLKGRDRSTSSDDRGRGGDATLTEAGFMIGTIPYMAPEQMTGERVSRQTDVYAIASLLFRMLAGRLPFEGSDDEVINAKISDERPDLGAIQPALPTPLADLLLQSFALEPSERPTSARALAGALREALSESTTAGDDVTVTLGVQLGALARVLDKTRAAVEAFADVGANAVEDRYLRARDRLLSLDAPLMRAQRLADALKDDAASDEALKTATEEVASMIDALAAVTRPLIAAPEHEFAEYLGAIWGRVHTDASAVVRTVETRLGTAQQPARPVTPAPVAALFGAPGSRDEEVLAPLVADLLRPDPLSNEDALDALCTKHLEATARTLLGAHQQVTPLVRDLVTGLWRSADQLLLTELYGDGRVHRLLPTLTALPLEEAEGFRRLGALFTGAPQGSKTAHQHVDEILTLGDDDQRGVLTRCLLVHPLFTVRELAASRTPLSDFWSVAVHPRVRAPVLRAIFGQVIERAQPEYLKVFFLCVQDQLQASASTEEVEEAFLILQRMFHEPCFSEDVVFEPLLGLDRSLRQRAAELGGGHPPEAYSDDVAAFTARGAVDSAPPESMRDVPLPIQRKMAREGHFLSYFACHANERVAKEVLPHLLRLQDILRFLRLSQIHRAVLVELARERRFFRKDAARLALLQNPRTPASTARVYLPLVPQEQIKQLSKNKHIGVEVRTLAQTFLDKLAERRTR